MTVTVEERFWAKVDKSGGADACWPWTSAIMKCGYGSFFMGGKSHSAHRLAFQFARGAIPSAESYHGTCVCHTCDNRKCVNPAHLFLGSQRDNVADRDAKGRQARGEKARHRHTAEDVHLMRRMRASGARVGFIARRFGAAYATVAAIVNGKSWRGQ